MNYEESNFHQPQSFNKSSQSPLKTDSFLITKQPKILNMSRSRESFQSPQRERLMSNFSNVIPINGINNKPPYNSSKFNNTNYELDQEYRVEQNKTLKSFSHRLNSPSKRENLKIRELKKENNSLKNKLHHLKKIRAGWSKQKNDDLFLDDLKRQNNYLTFENNNMIEELQILHQEYQNLLKINTDLGNKILDMEDDMKEKDEQLKKNHQEIQNSKRTIENDFNEMKLKYLVHKTRVNVLENENQQLQQSLK